MNEALDAELWVGRVTDELNALNYSATTLERYRGEVPRFLEFLRRQGLQSLAGLTKAHLHDYRQELLYRQSRGKQLSMATVQVHLATAVGFVRFLVRNDFLLMDVSKGLRRPKRRRGLPRVVLSEPETLRLLESPDVASWFGLRDRAILELLYGTGMRNGELGALLLDQLDWARNVLFIAHGKGDKSRWVPFGEESAIWLSEYVHQCRPRLARAGSPGNVFLSRSGRPLDRWGVTNLVLRHAKNVQLDKHVTAHCLRHTCATHMLKRGAGLRHLQTLLGHESVHTTQIYTRVEVSELRKVLLRCHPRERSR